MGERRIFPQVVEAPVQIGRASYEEKCIFHERILYRYLMRKIEGWSVRDFLKGEKIEDYALYAVTDFTKLFLMDLDQKEKGERRGIVCDKNADAFPPKFQCRPVITPKELVIQYKKGKIKKVIVMSILHENEIFENLLKEGILLKDIISFVSIVYS